MNLGSLFRRKPAVAVQPVITESDIDGLRQQLCTENVDPKLMRAELLTACDKFGRTVIHETAIAGSLRHIPENLLTKELINMQDANGNSVLHLAARSGYLNRIPSRFLEVKDLLVPNQKDETPLMFTSNQEPAVFIASTQ